MREPLPAHESKESAPDDAIKFVLAEPLPAEFLAEQNATSFTLTVDWLDVAEESETKVARKEFVDGTVQLLLITKVTTEDGRTAQKQPISEEEHAELQSRSVRHLEKNRHEFIYDGFAMKYDVFTDNDQLLEVDGTDERDRESFDPASFPYSLSPVSGIDGPAAVDWLEKRQTERNL